MRIVERWNSDGRKRGGEMWLVPHAPVRTLQECADELGITLDQAWILHQNAIQKIGAALAAYGYNKERRR